MKAREEFRLENDWWEYLRYIYAGQIMQAVCSHYMIFDEKDREHNVKAAVDLTDRLIEELKKKKP